MNRPVNISIVLNGYVAQVGCQTLVFNDLDCLLNNLKCYLQDPAKAEREFLIGAKNRKITMGYQGDGVEGTNGPVGTRGPIGDVGRRGPEGPAGCDAGAQVFGYAASAPAPDYPPPPVAGTMTTAVPGNY